VALEAALREIEDVLAAGPQRRHLQLERVEAVVEVAAELPLGDERRQAAVGRSHDPDVDLLGLVAADALHGELLQRTQQLGLRRQGQVGDLVEEQRPAVRLFELAAPAPDTGRGAVLDAEELGFEQRLDDGRAVDGDERAAAPPAPLVDLARDQLLADAALALDQDGEIGAGDAIDLLPHGLDLRAGPMQPVAVPIGERGDRNAIAGGPLDLGDDGADLPGRRDEGMPGMVLRDTRRARHLQGECPPATRDLQHGQARIDVRDDRARRALAEPHEGDTEVIANHLLEAGAGRLHVPAAQPLDKRAEHRRTPIAGHARRHPRFPQHAILHETSLGRVRPRPRLR
jgi:hypothetical protein